MLYSRNAVDKKADSAFRLMIDQIPLPEFLMLAGHNFCSYGKVCPSRTIPPGGDQKRAKIF